jgi:putative transcriptional regulator
VRNRLRELRAERGLTQEDIAAEVGVSRQTIISIESGRYNPSILLAYKLAHAFALTIEDVFLCAEETGESNGDE